MGSESPVGDHFASHAVPTPAFGLTLAIGELSFFTYHLSPITYHLSPITYHLSTTSSPTATVNAN
jgi:hypothetical protein